MADIVDDPAWVAVPLLEEDTIALGGTDGPMNSQAKALAARTALLKQLVDSFNQNPGGEPDPFLLNRINHIGYNPKSINVQLGTSYKLTAGDETSFGVKVMSNSPIPASIIVPRNADVPLQVGAEFEGFQGGQGTVVFLPDGDGVIINSATSFQTRAQNSTWKLTQTAINVWLLSGDLNTSQPPVNIVPPTVPGNTTQTQGSVLVVNVGTWSGSPAPTFTYQWTRDGVDIGGATSASYATVSGDNGKAVRCRVTGTNASGASSATSNAINIVAQAGTPPANTVAPAISGSLTSGSTLTVTNGTWSGTPTSYAIQWLRNGTPISGQTASTYIISDADVGQSIRALVTATNADGSVSAPSNTVTPTAVAPVNTVRPVITGTATVGSILSVSNGTWLGTPTSYAYQWQRNGSNIDGATASTYTLQSSEAGTNVTCTVTATNASGSTGATTVNTSISGATPLNTTAPGINGTPVAGNLMSVDVGVWQNNPTYSYQWRRNEVPIPGATASTYTTTGEDGDKMLSVLVTGTNTAGFLSVAAPGIFIDMASGLPVNSVAPAVTGTTPVGSTLTCTTGTWSNTPAFTYQWFRTASPIPGATANTYTTTVNDDGQTVYCQVTATNASGSPTANSNGINVGAAGGSITAFTAVDNGSVPINLTALGTVHWRYYSSDTVASQDRKNSGSGIVSIGRVNGAFLPGFGGASQTFSASDGTPTASFSRAGNNAIVQDNTAAGNVKFVVVANAIGTQRTLKVYVITYNCNLQLTATLSDGSAPPQTINISGSASSYKAITISVSFTSSGSGTLTLEGLLQSLGGSCAASPDAASMQ